MIYIVRTTYRNGFKFKVYPALEGSLKGFDEDLTDFACDLDLSLFCIAIERVDLRELDW
jgi:hypothetical protein